MCDGQSGGVSKPKKPTNLEATLLNNTTVNLKWVDNSNNEDDFLIYRSVNKGSWKLLTTVDANITEYKDNSLVVGNSYEYKIQAKNIAGVTESSIVSVTPNVIFIQDGVDNSAISLVINCASCHHSNSSDSNIPVIDGLDKEYLIFALKGYKNKNRFGYAMNRIMDGYSDNDIELMAEYYSHQKWVGNKIIGYDVNTIERGKELFEDNCKVCHGADAKGKVATVNISSQSEDYLKNTMLHYAKGLNSGGNAGMLDVFQNSIGQDMDKINAISKYLAVGLEIPDGDSNTIRGFDTKYQNSTNSIEVSWDYINPKSTTIEIFINDKVVKRLIDATQKSIILSNDGTNPFITGQTYSIKMRTVADGVESFSTTKMIEILTDESRGKEHYNHQCKVCHGVNGTQRADITKWDATKESFVDFTRNSNMDESYYSGCDDECLEFISIYVQNILIPRAKDNNSSIAKDVPSNLKRGYRLLNRIEYTNSLYSIFDIKGDEVRNNELYLDYTSLPKDNIVDGYNTSRDMVRVDEDKIKALYLVSIKVEKYLNSLIGKNGNQCWIRDYNFCRADINEFLDIFAPKIFRRPLTQIEKDEYKKLNSVPKIVGDMIMSPKFLYRSEMGELNSTTGIYELDNYEIATAISYTIAGTSPDDKLLELAKEGRLTSSNVRVTEAVRLSKSQTGKDKLDRFIGRWLLGDNIYSLTEKNPTKFQGYTKEVRDAQSNQILKFFRMVMSDSEQSSYKDLFINDKIVTNKTLSDYYKNGMSSNHDFEIVPATDKRYGILTLGGVDSKYANSEESHPFKRGKFVLARLMCHPIGPPGNGGDVPAVQEHLGDNKRDRYANHVNDPSCAACHSMIDPIGFTWEKYDGTGRFRTKEPHPQEYGGSKPIDTQVTLKGLFTFDPNEVHSADGIRDLSELIASSDRGAECLALQYYRYSSGDIEANIETSDVVKKISSDFKNENYDLQSLFNNIVKLKSFVTRIGE